MLWKSIKESTIPGSVCQPWRSLLAESVQRPEEVVLGPGERPETGVNGLREHRFETQQRYNIHAVEFSWACTVPVLSVGLRILPR
jgi:hypothetical protein